MPESREIELDPRIYTSGNDYWKSEDYILPMTHEKLISGSLVGILYNGENSTPDKVYLIQKKDEDYWMYDKIGEVREDYDPTLDELEVPVKVYMATEDSLSGAGRLFYAKLRPGKYIPTNLFVGELQELIRKHYFKK